MLQNPQPKILVSAKRGSNERRGIHAWHPYYAGYSEAFVSSAIDYLDITTNDIILDPWNGSGTTGTVASSIGIRSIGCEINPVMNIFSSAKTSYLSSRIPEIRKLLIKIKDASFEKKIKLNNNDPLLEFMSESLCRHIREIYSGIKLIRYPSVPIDKRFIKILESGISKLNPFESFFTAALFITARKLAGYKGGSNPTWVKTLKEKPSYTIDVTFSCFEDTIDLMLKDLIFTNEAERDIILHLPLEANSKHLPINNSSIDAVITSPPYLTRIDYAMSTRPELLIISDSKNLRVIREASIGAPVIVDESINCSSKWGETCTSLLKHVECHKSKAAKSYYLKNMLQYFRDIEMSIQEIKRTLKTNGKALVVVQSSYFKEYEINLGQIYVEIGEHLDLECQIASRELVRSHMAYVNTKSNRYKAKKMYYEDVVFFSKNAAIS